MASSCPCSAANQAYVDAQYDLGLRYYYGNGVAENKQKAVEWFQKAANQGDADAQYHLGYCYAHGDGVAKNTEKAVEWYQKAAEQGHEEAIGALKNIYK